MSNLAASVRARLLNIAKTQGPRNDVVLRREIKEIAHGKDCQV